MKLSRSNLLTAAAAANVKVPKYLLDNANNIRPGMLHIGVGNFHRAHLATYMDDLFHMDAKLFADWALVGAGVLPFDKTKRDMLAPQNWLSTVVERDDQDGVNARIVGSMIDFLPVDPPQFIMLKEKLLDSNIKIVSLTVTEGGYFLDADGDFNEEHPQIVHDVEHVNEPTTIFGLIVQALRKRRDSNQKPFTVLSCDNVPHNGNVCRHVVVGLARMIDSDLAKWIDEHVQFPNGMVDRITPATTDYERQYVLDQFGYEDVYPVFCEPYRQWVLEDKFSQGRPPLEQVGVQFVQDVAPYETMKIRLLNGGHASLCYPAALLNVEYVHEAVQHPVIGPFLNALERHELVPCVPPVPDTDLIEYWETIQHRFSNSAIKDRIHRICFDGSNRQGKFIVPCVAQAIKEGNVERTNGLALVCALWCRYCQGKTESGETIPSNDPDWDNLQKVAEETFTKNPNAWLRMENVYGKTVGNDEGFRENFATWVKVIADNGVEAAMKQYIQHTNT
ncbi:hypothetical protein MPSEU_000551700 [Mayamaea pseudoterrestris]|nr:hypothetical protein MPSEU_000551700 [Mayamaea pseudoterrestris]